MTPARSGVCLDLEVKVPLYPPINLNVRFSNDVKVSVENFLAFPRFVAICLKGQL